MSAPFQSRLATLLALVALGSLACSNSSPATATSGGPGTTTSSPGTGSGSTGGAGSSGGTTSGAASSGSSGTGGSTGSGSTGGTTGGGPCLGDGGNPCQPTNGVPPGCWFNPQTSDQIMNGCTLARYDSSIPAPPPGGSESLPLYDGGSFPLPSP
jgi:hypothetical protein